MYTTNNVPSSFKNYALRTLSCTLTPIPTHTLTFRSTMIWSLHSVTRTHTHTFTLHTPTHTLMSEMLYYAHSLMHKPIHPLIVGMTTTQDCSLSVRPVNHVKILKGQPCRFAFSKLVQAWYKIFPPDHLGQVEINDSTMLRNNTSTAYSCAEDQILQLKILGTSF